MKLPKTPHRNHGDPIIPLINVIFLLIIFFMVAGSIRPPLALDVQAPESTSEGAAESAPAIVVDRDGRVGIGAAVLDNATLAEWLRGNAIPGEGAIAVAADQATPAEKLLDVLDALKAHTSRPVTLTVRRAA